MGKEKEVLSGGLTFWLLWVRLSPICARVHIHTYTRGPTHIHTGLALGAVQHLHHASRGGFFQHRLPLPRGLDHGAPQQGLCAFHPGFCLFVVEASPRFIVVDNPELLPFFPFSPVAGHPRRRPAGALPAHLHRVCVLEVSPCCSLYSIPLPLR